MNHHTSRRRFLGGVAAMSGLAAGRATLLAAEDKFLTSARLGDFNLFYEVHGEGPPVVFAHGAGGTHMSWWQQVPILSQRYTCITIDHRTFGFSRDVANGPGRKAFVPDLKGLLDRLGLQKVSLVAQSMGGTTALGFASAYPERVSALVMSDTTGGYSDPDIERLRNTGSTRTQADPLGRAFAPGFSKRDPARAFLYREISAITQAYQNAPAAAAPAAASASPGTNIRPLLDKKVPVLFIVGEEDQLVSPSIIEAMHRKMPGSAFVKVLGAGHSVYWEKPEEYNRIVSDFLQRHAGA